MKVLLIHNTYRSHLTGGEDVVFERERKALEQRLGKDNVFVLTKANDRIKKSLLPFTIWSNRALAKQVFKTITQHHIDLVHVHNFFPLVTPSVMVAAKRAGAKVVHTLHNYRWWCLSGTQYYRGKKCETCAHKRWMWPGVVRGCYRGSKLQSLLASLAFVFYKRKKVQNAIDGYLVLSEHQRAALSARLPIQKLFLKPNPVDSAQQTAVKKSGYIFVGRLEAGKGIGVLLNSFARLNSDQHLTVVGDGPDLESLKKRYPQPNIQFMGSVPRDQVSKLLAEAKFCIHPSLYDETFGLVLIEAMAQGTPVVGFDIGTRKEFIEHGVNGVLCTPDTLVKTLNNLEQFDYPLLSQQAQAFAKNFDSQKLIEQQLSVYQQVGE